MSVALLPLAEHLKHAISSICREPEQFSGTFCGESGRKEMKESRTILQSTEAPPGWREN